MKSNELAVVGMSHVEALSRGWDRVREEYSRLSVTHYNLRRFRKVIAAQETDRFSYAITDREREMIKRGADEVEQGGARSVVDGYISVAAILDVYREFIAPFDAVAFNIEGNEHNIIGLTELYRLTDAERIVRNGARSAIEGWLDILGPLSPSIRFLMLPPPPVRSVEHILRSADLAFQEKLKSHPIRNANERFQLWQCQCDEASSIASERGITLIHLPQSVFDEDGLMAADCLGSDATHGNAIFGERVMRSVVDVLKSANAPKASHPYASLPDHQYWKQSISEVLGAEVDPVVAPRFQIETDDLVATAGSCFAQHISKRLMKSNFRFFKAEAEPVGGTSGGGGNYEFSARYGNIYTARQLLQLFDRAFGYYRPIEGAWKRRDGKYCDPFRPGIEPAGFDSAHAVHESRQAHLDAVRRMFLELDVFVFTLGLTECWLSKLDGAAYPVAPGVAGGEYGEQEHRFVNFSANEVTEDLSAFLSKLDLVNPRAKIILTVSPVPLVATWECRHVLESTIYSKSVLRVAAGEIVATHKNVQYFPSYEIIVGPHAKNRYYAEDCRSITEAGVDHVMRVFMSRMTKGTAFQPPLADDAVRESAMKDVSDFFEASCDEERYARPDG